MTDRYPDLQGLFADPIRAVEQLDPGIEDHGSLVFRVTTEREIAIARSFRLNEVAGPFWGNLRLLFGLEPVRASEVAAVFRLLGAMSPIPVPSVMRSGAANGREWVVVELMRGTPLDAFATLDDRGLVEFGRALATIHARRFDTLGTPSGSVRFPPGEFPGRLARTLRAALVSHPGQAAFAVEMCERAERLAPPKGGALVMPDIAPWQFLRRGRRITALIDVDAYVVGPRELELVFLEYFVDERAAELIGCGYERVLELPPLGAARAVYRVLGYVLDILPGIELETWMGWPERF